MEYRVTRLLEPPLTAIGGDRAPRLRAQRWAASWIVGLAILVFIPGLLSGSPKATVAKASEFDAPVEDRREMVIDEWVRLVGSAPIAPADVAPPRPQWGIRPPELATPAAQQLLAGDAQVLKVGALPVELGRLVRMYDAANSQAQLAAAGGAVRLVGGDLPPWMWGDAKAVPSVQQARQVLVALPPALDGRRMSGLEAWVEGINYSDPLGVGLPLLRAGGFEDHRLTANFTVRDFATRDGAPYMRVSETLVAGLERLRAEAGPILVISGYRHPVYNARADVGGARHSRHQAGQAADVFSETRTSVEIAHLAVQTMGCGIGLGLGRNTVHIDVRGYLQTWTYPGAPLSKSAFRRWIYALCGQTDSAIPTLPRQMTNEEWLALLAEGSADEEEVVHQSDAAVEEAVDEAQEAAVPLPTARPSAERIVRRDLAAFARASAVTAGPGVVVVDLRDGPLPEGDALQRRARYVRATLPEARRMQIGDLLDWVARQPEGSHFVYAIRSADGRLRPGIAPMSGGPDEPTLPLQRPAPAPRPETPAPEPSSSDAPARPAAEAPSAPAGQWFLHVSSAADFDAAQREETYFQALLESSRLPVRLRTVWGQGSVGYHIAVGPFETAEQARQAADRLSPLLDAPAELVESSF